MGFAIHGAAALCVRAALPVLNITLKLYKLASSFASKIRNTTMIPTLRLWLTKYIAKLRRKGQVFRDRAKAEEVARTGCVESWS
eukprot:12571632-Heterocapsa_arctica.AAC.1